MNIYLAGPMSGLPEYNFPAFKRYAYTLRREGHTVFSPAENDEKNYGEEVFKGLEGTEPVVNPRQVIQDDLLYIINKADAVAMMPGWEYSPGACLEHACAKFLKLKFIYL